MKRYLLLIMLIAGLAISSRAAYRENHGFGLGVQVGEPTGITLKYWPGFNTSIDLTAGWNFFSARPSVQFAYLIHFPIGVSAMDISAYSGMGLSLGTARFNTVEADSTFYLSGRVPVGVELISNHLGVYGEVDVLMNLLPDNKLGIGGGAGFRFYF